MWDRPLCFVACLFAELSPRQTTKFDSLSHGRVRDIKVRTNATQQRAFSAKKRPLLGLGNQGALLHGT
jgi:hypothetical protein